MIPVPTDYGLSTTSMWEIEVKRSLREGPWSGEGLQEYGSFHKFRFAVWFIHTRKV